MYPIQRRLNKFVSRIRSYSTYSVYAKYNGVELESKATGLANEYDLILPTPAEWKISINNDAAYYMVNITTHNSYAYYNFLTSDLLHCTIDGSKILPINSPQVWLMSIDSPPAYTTLNQILADKSTLLKLVKSEESIKYLKRCSSWWISTICANEDAMEVIGSYDDCVDALMQDDTWASAIRSSTYRNKVLPISTPTMTSESEPSGWAYSPTVSASGHEGYKAFDKNTSTWWESVTGYPRWVYYMFPSKEKCYIAYCRGFLYDATAKIRASNDGTNWDDVSSDFYLEASDKWLRVNATQKYKYYELYSTFASSWTQVSELDFYCREGGIQSWLEAGGITNKSYTTLAEVLADSTTLNALMASSVAVNYLVECPSWASTICADSGAMTAIGANNNCANILLADSEWLKAIVTSTYKESVLNVKVPIMTSNTAPSGKCTASSANSSYPAWKAFDSSTSSLWVTTTTANAGATSSEGWVGYQFTSATKCYAVVFFGYTNGPVQTWSIKGSKNGTDFTTLASGTTFASQADQRLIFTQNIDSYTYYRMYLTQKNNTSGTAGFPRATEVRFYGREDV